MVTATTKLAAWALRLLLQEKMEVNSQEKSCVFVKEGISQNSQFTKSYSKTKSHWFKRGLGQIR